jgi:hypothetical protein
VFIMCYLIGQVMFAHKQHLNSIRDEL